MTLKDSIISTLKSLKPELAARFGVNSLGVFGSITRQDFLPETSDVDIIVDFSRPIGIEFIDLADFLEKKIKRNVDLVSRKGIKDQYLKVIEPEIIYV
jgi:predicted nucleotidyltransferase